MLENIPEISQNKNLLMLISAGIYILALYSVLSGHLLLFSILLTVCFILMIIRQICPIKYIIIWTILFYIGVANTSIRLKDTDDLLNLAPANSEITGTIVSIPQGFLEHKPKFFFKVNKIKIGNFEKIIDNEKILVTINSPDAENEIKLYKTGTLTGRLSTPFKAGNPSQFDYGNYLRNHNTYAVFYANSFSVIDKKLTLKEKTLVNINNYREQILKIHSKYLKSPNLELLGGIVFGDDAVAPPVDLKKSFVNSGLLHILAASGMNVAFIYGFFFGIMTILRINYRLRVVLGMITVLIYTLMTGLGASIIRAAGMLIFVLIGKLIDRDAHSVSLLSFVALLMLLYNPLYINNLGFQLSFIVTFGLLIMGPAVLKFENKIVNYISGTISIPIIAQLWVIPIQIFYFNNISLYSIFANIMSVPLLAVISFGGFISSLLAGIPHIADFVCKVFDFILSPFLSTLVNISDFWGHLPHSTIQTTHPNIFQIILYYLILLCVTSCFYPEIRNKYLTKIKFAIAILSIIFIITLIPIKNTNLEILSFDVGNADCFLIKTPQNEYILIDSGKAGYNGGKSQAEVIILKYFKDHGIKNINSLIITHFDNDHCGGVADLIKNLKIKRIYVNDLTHNSIAANSIYKAAKENNSEVILAQNNQIIYNSKGLILTNLLGKNTDNDNENSIITLLECNKFKMLFTGDVSADGLNSIIKFLPKNINVLKVPHHGAIGGLDNNLIQHLNPDFSIISVGENKFGHPSIYTLKLLNKSEILRTDIDNAILLKYSKNSLKIYTYDINKRKFIKKT